MRVSLQIATTMESSLYFGHGKLALPLQARRVMEPSAKPVARSARPRHWIITDGPRLSRRAIVARLSQSSEPLFERAYRFGRALVVGGGATLTDFSVFTACVRALDVAPAAARLPALLCGACFQFFGNRSFTFRATSAPISRQAR